MYIMGQCQKCKYMRALEYVVPHLFFTLNYLIVCMFPWLQLSTVMNAYLSTDGWFLLRPSSTSEGQLTLAVT